MHRGTARLQLNRLPLRRIAAQPARAVQAETPVRLRRRTQRDGRPQDRPPSEDDGPIESRQPLRRPSGGRAAMSSVGPAVARGVALVRTSSRGPSAGLRRGPEHCARRSDRPKRRTVSLRASLSSDRRFLALRAWVYRTEARKTAPNPLEFQNVSIQSSSSRRTAKSGTKRPSTAPEAWQNARRRNAVCRRRTRRLRARTGKLARASTSSLRLHRNYVVRTSSRLIALRDMLTKT
jgi:hypothetical protein